MSSHNDLATVERCVPSTFFATIDDETLALIVQWTTCLCSFENGYLVHPPEMMFDTYGPFYPSICKMYSRLMISYDDDTINLDPDPIKAGVQESLVISPRLAERFGVFSCLGPMLKAVRILSPERGPNDLSTKQDISLVRNMLQYCKNLKSLKLFEFESECLMAFTFVRSLISGFAHNLEEIFISDMPRELRLSDLAFPKLKSLALFALSDLDDVIRLLHSVGASLEKIRFTSEISGESPSKWRELFNATRAYCSKLSSICMFGDMLPKEDYEQLLVSYGPNLRFAGFHENLNDCEEFESMSRIIQLCPNVEFNVVAVDGGDDDSLFWAASRIAQHITKIELELDMDEEDGTDWEAFEWLANRLNKVKTIRSSYSSSKALHAIFATPKLSLEELHFECLDLSLDRAIAGKMRSSVSNLWLVTLRIPGQDEFELFESLLTVCSKLRRASIVLFFNSSREETVDYCNRLLRAMRDCQKLEYVDIETIADLWPSDYNEARPSKNDFIDAQLFRFRNVHINIDGREMFAKSCQIIFDE